MAEYNAHAETTQTDVFFCVNTGSVNHPLTGLANSERQLIDTNDTFSLWLGRVSLNTFKNRLHKKCKHLIGFSVRDKILILIQGYSHNPYACIQFLAAYINLRGASYNTF